MSYSYRLSNWLQYLAFKQLNQQYEVLDHDNDHARTEPVLGYFQLVSVPRKKYIMNNGMFV